MRERSLLDLNLTSRPGELKTRAVFPEQRVSPSWSSRLRVCTAARERICGQINGSSLLIVPGREIQTLYMYM